MFEMGKRLSKVFQMDQLDGEDIYSNFSLDIEKLPSMSPCLMCIMLYFRLSSTIQWGVLDKEGRERNVIRRRKKRENTHLQQVESKRAKS